jgi:flagellar biosynthesis protein FlhF
MIVKTFRAPTVQEALARVKSTVGASALIIETRRVAPAGLFGFLRKPVVEVVVGIEDTPAPDPRIWDREVADLRGLEKEIGGIRDALRQFTQPAPAALPAPFAELQQRLVGQGVEASRATALVEECRSELVHAGGGDPLARLRAVVARRFRVTGETTGTPGGGLRVVALVGPPGAGKTTLLVKLAGRAALTGGDRVALATVDFFRVGAVEQLKAYAEILGVPFHAVHAPGEVPGVLEAERHANWLFVDTPGLAGHDVGRLEQLVAWLKAFPSADCRLVLSAASETQAALDAMKSYKAVGFGALAFARLDEARRHGLLLAAAEAAGVPVAHLGTGQDVASGLDLATPERLAELVLGR